MRLLRPDDAESAGGGVSWRTLFVIGATTAVIAVCYLMLLAWFTNAWLGGFATLAFGIALMNIADVMRTMR